MRSRIILKKVKIARMMNRLVTRIPRKVMEMRMRIMIKITTVITQPNSLSSIFNT